MCCAVYYLLCAEKCSKKRKQNIQLRTFSKPNHPRNQLIKSHAQSFLPEFEAINPSTRDHVSADNISKLAQISKTSKLPQVCNTSIENTEYSLKQQTSNQYPVTYSHSPINEYQFTYADTWEKKRLSLIQANYNTT